MSVVNKNAMGAGDGIINTIPQRKRAQIPSSRRFATRGVGKDATLRLKLEEALESFATPPQSPLRKRAQTVAEITPSKKHLAPVKLKSEPHESSRAPTSASRMDDAGRRVSHQLVLNAWRRRRRDVAALSESRDRLQTQVQQLQMQVDVVQKLRESEANRRTEALNESKTLRGQVECLERKNRNLEEEIFVLDEREISLKETIEKINIDLKNERNNLKTLSNQKMLCEQAYNRDKQQMAQMVNEKNRLLNRIEECERQIEEEKKSSRSFQNLVKMTEHKYVESVDKYKELEKKCEQLEAYNKLEKMEKLEVQGVLNELQLKCEKLESKIHDLKKTVNTVKQQRKSLQEENQRLYSTVEELETRINLQNQKPVWRCTGEFMVASFVNMAYLLFPALPNAEHIGNNPPVKCSIGFGNL